MARELTASSALPRRLLAWAAERFPHANGVLFLVLYATAVAVGQALTGATRLRVGPRTLACFAGAWCFFLMLRVFDEHKDYELDAQNHPERVLQRGLITLTHLKVLGSLAIATQLGVSLLSDGGEPGPVTTLWLVVMAWSTLMAKEFFVGARLERRLVLYALSHMLVMPLALVWMARIGVAWLPLPFPLPLTIGLLAALSFASGASFEVTRKLKAPEDERDTVGTYTRSLGLSVAPLVAIAFLLAAAALQVALVQELTGAVAWTWVGLIGLGLAPAVAALWRFRSAPSAAAAKRNESLVGVAMLAGYAVLLAASVAGRGVEWNLAA